MGSHLIGALSGDTVLLAGGAAGLHELSSRVVVPQGVVIEVEQVHFSLDSYAAAPSVRTSVSMVTTDKAVDLSSPSGMKHLTGLAAQHSAQMVPQGGPISIYGRVTQRWSSQPFRPYRSDLLADPVDPSDIVYCRRGEAIGRTSSVNLEFKHARVGNLLGSPRNLHEVVEFRADYPPYQELGRVKVGFERNQPSNARFFHRVIQPLRAPRNWGAHAQAFGSIFAVSFVTLDLLTRLIRNDHLGLIELGGSSIGLTPNHSAALGSLLMIATGLACAQSAMQRITLAGLALLPSGLGLFSDATS